MRMWKLCALSAAIMAGCMGEISSDEDPAEEWTSSDVQPTGKGFLPRDLVTQDVSSEAPPQTNGILYHGGPVMLGTTNVHFILYGNWTGNSAVTILTDFVRNLGGSPYYGINTTYSDRLDRHVSNAVAFAGSVNDNYSHGTALSDAAVRAIVAATNPTDTNGVYFVLTSADVNATSGFCTQYCGWHTHARINGRDIKYSFVGNPARCIRSCAPQTTGPNGNAGADGMASILAHELEEAVTDPDLNAWADASGEENADKCAWTFGTQYTAANGARANMRLGARDFLIQQNWVNARGGLCALHP
jgi:hypothetical protein